MANTTWNPLDKTAGITLSGGNLIATRTVGGLHGVRAIDKQVTGKFYWECTCNAFTFLSNFVGHTSQNADLSSSLGNQGGCLLRQNGDVWVDGNAASPSINLGGITAGNVVCTAIDCSARLVWFRQGSGGNWNASVSADPATGAGGAVFSSIGNGIPVCPVVSLANASDQVTANFGDSTFSGAVPAGFTAGWPVGGGGGAAAQARAMVLA